MERFLEWEKQVKLNTVRKPVSSVQERPQVRERKDIHLGQVEPAVLKSRTSVAVEAKKKAATDTPSFAEQTKASSQPSSTTKTAEALATARSNYYDSWDKFDVDKALEAIDQKESEKPKASSVKKTDVKPASKPAPTTTAAEEKEKVLIEGNAAFKKGDYKKAIEHYTLCMKLDTSNSVYPINRAMALLKLERFAEVEADCTTGLKLDPKNVKALWRRGIARRSMGKLAEARGDFEAALKIEPTNKSVKDELAKLDQAAAAKPKATKTSTASTPAPATSTTTATPKSQPAPSGIKSSARVSIVEVDSDSESTLFSKTPKDVSNTSNIATASPLPLSPSSSQPKAPNKEPSLTSAAPREPSPASASAPAISVISETNSSPLPPATTSSSPTPSSQKTQPEPAIKAPSSTTNPSVKMNPPTTLLDFQRDWKSYSKEKNLLYQYLKLIKPQDLPHLFKSSFESDYFSSMLPVYKEFYIPNEPVDLLYNTLDNLAKVQRFGMALMFLSKSESQRQGSYTVQDLSSLASKYRVKLN
ncbi:hypothetical protein BGW42_001390 [Actinomortierella wolfii]|nr:hypothetical protein BGW42_001390 [Actinomortierella wolfii]